MWVGLYDNHILVVHLRGRGHGQQPGVVDSGEDCVKTHANKMYKRSAEIRTFEVVT